MRCPRLFGTCIWAFALALIFLSACAKVNPTAPDGSILYVSANPPTIAAGGAKSMISVVGYEATGIPLSDGTVVYFTCDIGSIDRTAITKNGTADATFTSNSISGVAHIKVTSGNSTGDAEVIVGSAALAAISLGASPGVLPHGGGSSTITAVAFDASNNLLVDIPIVFSTTAGTLESGGMPVRTNSEGKAQDVLTTTSTATVTATSGTISATTQVTVEQANVPPTAAFVYSPASPNAGDKVYFDASGSTDDDGTIVSYSWNFGDGNSGSGKKPSHIYAGSGAFVVSLVVTDDDGATGATNQTVTVAAVGLDKASPKRTITRKH